MAKPDIVLKIERMSVDVRIDLAARNLNSLMTMKVELPPSVAAIERLERPVALPIKLILPCKP